MHERLEERAGGQDDGPSLIESTAPTADAGDAVRLDDDGLDHFLAEGQPFLLLDGQLGQELVGLLVALGAGAVHGRAFAPVEQPELDGRGVGDDPHRAAQGVDLADNLTLGDAADRRIAAHLPDRVAVHRQKRRAQAHPRGRQGRLDAGMPSPDHDNVESIGIALLCHEPVRPATVCGASSRYSGDESFYKSAPCIEQRKRHSA